MTRALGLLLTAVFVASACSGGSGTSPSLPETTTTPAVTENFGGTVHVGGSDSHSFNAAAGAIAITMTAAGPPPTIFMGLGVGTPSDPTCTIFSGGAVNTQAGTTAQLSGSVASAGPLCVVVYDIGNQAADITYAVTVIHN
jgi:hypothetical protein